MQPTKKGSNPPVQYGLIDNLLGGIAYVAQGYPSLVNRIVYAWRVHFCEGME